MKVKQLFLFLSHQNPEAEVMLVDFDDGDMRICVPICDVTVHEGKGFHQIELETQIKKPINLDEELQCL